MNRQKVEKRVAIMQPYLFPYIGYFQLLYRVEDFVFYDDVNFIKRGFVNRNMILLQGRPHQFSIPCRGVSQNTRICDIQVATSDRRLQKSLLTIRQAYSRSPQFNKFFPVVEAVFNEAQGDISWVSGRSVELVTGYLGLKRNFYYSSRDFERQEDLDRSQQLIHICHQLGASHYVNSIGGKHLYSVDEFASAGIDLCFLESSLSEYKQLGNGFQPSLSIIDLLMNVSVDEALDFVSMGSLRRG